MELNLKNYFYLRKNTFSYNIFFLFIAYLRKFLILYIANIGTGTWAYGIDNIFQLNDKNIDFFSYLNKILFSTINIFSQSLYPYKENQLFFGYLILILVLISFFKFRNSSRTLKFTIIFYLLNYVFTILLATYSGYSFAPTRHNIYLFTLPILSIILLILDIYIKKIKINKIINFMLVILSLSFFLFFNGLKIIN